MNKPRARRDFIRQALVSCGLLGSARKLAGFDRNRQDCTGKVESLYLDLQKRDAREKAHLFRALTERYGSGVLEVVERFVIEDTKAKLENAPITRRDIEGIMENLWDKTHSTHQFRIEEKTTAMLKLRVTRCLYAEEMRKWNAADIGLAFFCSYDHGFCMGLNQRIIFNRTKTLMAGDDCCDHAYELAATDLAAAVKTTKEGSRRQAEALLSRISGGRGR